MFGFMLREAISAMFANRLRSFLTMLGMIIGVAAVILMLAIGAGVQQQVNNAIASMGSNLFIVMPGATSANGVRTGYGGAVNLTLGDANAIKELSGVKYMAPLVQMNSQVIYGTNNWSTQVIGTNADYLGLRDWALTEGYVFDDAEMRSGAQVALVGQQIVENLFGGESPLGETIRIRNQPFQVIGVLTSKGQSLDGRDQDDTIIVPLTTSQRRLQGSRFRDMLRMIMVQAENEAAMPRVEAGMRQILRERHRLIEDQEDDFTVQNLTALANTAAETTAVMKLMLGAIASISLVVGGIGIMNIMLVSVTERTREIGIRMAIGARPADIRLQFLLEAVIISVAGCLIGVLIGVAGAFAVASTGKLLVLVTLSSMLLAFAVASGIGIFFGFYPANKAAKLKPIEALRYQ
ncbi:MAG: ABC transporter permease [Moraxellaceae bacterium]|jgi:putative ABC transport system permease protein|nr:ABC transporter permease [Moraxellaceae bacterium]MBP9046302.1 ABC transporter permease [Moraxellaceae bacterium]MBP9731709.1 ABC transporter permease [Moraxellaceae bacterium]MCC6201216.1 ABC transporter permease [Moraxellaceae bacterium]HQV41707.1 ABC transporter permease [Moraxellaceae bacterium]